MHEEIQKIIDHSFEYAQDLLIDTKEFYPFAANIDTIGNVHPLEFEFDPKKMPQVGEVLDSLTKYCETEMSEGRMHAYGLCFEANLKLEENGPIETCIGLKVKHKTERDLPDFYQVYKFDKANHPEFGEIFGVKNK
ncbi:MAG: hypothetical protein AB8B74_14590 [Crocinitomicaceae bacterium]